jgi:hypothetical protein
MGVHFCALAWPRRRIILEVTFVGVRKVDFAPKAVKARGRGRNWHRLRSRST